MLYTPITIEQWIDEQSELLESFRADIETAKQGGENNLYLMGRRDMLNETLVSLKIILAGPKEIA